MNRMWMRMTNKELLIFPEKLKLFSSGGLKQMRQMETNQGLSFTSFSAENYSQTNF